MTFGGEWTPRRQGTIGFRVGLILPWTISSWDALHTWSGWTTAEHRSCGRSFFGPLRELVTEGNSGRRPATGNRSSVGSTASTPSHGRGRPGLGGVNITPGSRRAATLRPFMSIGSGHGEKSRLCWTDWLGRTSIQVPLRPDGSGFPRPQAAAPGRAAQEAS